jgi:hypothetical protein
MIAPFHPGTVWQRIRACAALLAIIAVVLNGFAPGLHRVAMAHAAADAIVLCTVDGPVAADPHDGAPHDGAPSRQAADDCCGLCILGGAAIVAASPIAAALPTRVARAEAPPLDVIALRRAPTGPPLPARGPPLFS